MDNICENFGCLGKSKIFVQAVGLVMPNKKDTKNILKKTPIGTRIYCEDCHEQVYGTSEREFFLIPKSKFQGIIDFVVDGVTV